MMMAVTLTPLRRTGDAQETWATFPLEDRHPMPNVVHVIAQLDCGGTERQLLILASALRNRGWSQTVVTFRPDGVYQSRLAGNGIPVNVVPCTRSKLWRFCRFQWLVALRRPAIIHSWSLPTHDYVRLLQWPRNAPIVCEIRHDPRVPTRTFSAGDPVLHGFETAAYLRKTFRLFSKAHCRREQLRSSDIQSLGARHQASPRGDSAQHDHILGARPAWGAGVIASYRRRRQLETPEGLRRVAAPLSLLASRGTRVELLLAGEGPQRSDLEKLAGELGLLDSVVFLGRVDDVPGLFASAHVVVHPSYREGLSNSILEAMGEGVPVIASRVGGTPELVHDGETGLLVPPGCPMSIMRALQRLLADSPLRVQMGMPGWGSFVRIATPTITCGGMKTFTPRSWRVQADPDLAPCPSPPQGKLVLELERSCESAFIQTVIPR